MSLPCRLWLTTSNLCISIDGQIYVYLLADMVYVLLQIFLVGNETSFVGLGLPTVTRLGSCLLLEAAADIFQLNQKSIMTYHEEDGAYVSNYKTACGIMIMLEFY